MSNISKILKIANHNKSSADNIFQNKQLPSLGTRAWMEKAYKHEACNKTSSKLNISQRNHIVSIPKRVQSMCSFDHNNTHNDSISAPKTKQEGTKWQIKNEKNRDKKGLNPERKIENASFNKKEVRHRIAYSTKYSWWVVEVDCAELVRITKENQRSSFWVRGGMSESFWRSLSSVSWELVALRQNRDGQFPKLLLFFYPHYFDGNIVTFSPYVWEVSNITPPLLIYSVIFHIYIKK